MYIIHTVMLRQTAFVFVLSDFALGNTGIFILFPVTAFASSTTSLNVQNSSGEQLEVQWKFSLL